MGILELITIVFVISKVFAIGMFATLSWWLVFTPLYIALVLYLIMFIFLMYKHANFTNNFKK